jgi:shikimate dehydrogenase
VADPTRRVLLLGDPVGHSLSAVFQDAAFRAEKLDLRYASWRVTADQLAEAMRKIRADPGIAGANVTVPHKLAVAEHLDRLAGEAAALGAVNTVAREGNLLVGHNTDRGGFARCLDEAGIRAPGRALVLGAGGAARAVVAELRERAAEVILASRSAEAAAAVCSLLRPGQGRALAFGQVDRLLDEASIDLVVNATPIGMDGCGAPLDSRRLRPGQAVVDLVYRPVWTPLLEGARAAGATAVNGLGMLLYQGAAAFEIWTGRRAPLEAMRAALEGAAGASISQGAAGPSI